MFRLSVLLCAAIFVTLLVAGEDKGQLRPGLAAAVASGEGIVVVERKAAPERPAPAQPAVEIAATDVVPATAPAAAANEPVVTAASFTPPEPAPAAATPAPVFTLSALPTTRMEPAPEPEAEAEDAPSPAMGEVWYVTARSVNVREAPTTGSSVMGKLTRGEAVSVSFTEGSEWAQVRIEGDGLQGYVALRFLSPYAE